MSDDVLMCCGGYLPIHHPNHRPGCPVGRITALEAQLEEAKTLLKDGADAFYSQENKLERCEFRRDELLKEADALKAEVERLRCCGNCDRYDWEFDEMVCTSGRYQSEQRRLGMTNCVEPDDRCHFTPSRWAERGEGL